MPKTSLFLLAFFVVTNAFALPEAEFSGPRANLRVLTAFQALISVFEKCATEPSCLKDPADRELLKKISAQFPAQYKFDSIKFASTRENPELFKVASGPHRLMVTGTTPRDPIYVNLDALNADAKLLDPAFLSGMIAHELGHHTGIADSVEGRLEKFGIAIEAFARPRFFRAPFENGALEMWIYQPLLAGEALKPGTDAIPYIYLLSDVEVHSLTSTLFAHFDCPFGSSAVRRALIDELRVEPGRGRNRIVGKVRHHCDMGKGSKEVESTVSFDLVEARDAANWLWDDRSAVRLLRGWNAIESDVSSTYIALSDTQTAAAPRVTTFDLKLKPAPQYGWSFEAKVEGKGEFWKNVGCTLLLTSDSFLNVLPSGQTPAFSKNTTCEIVRRGGQTFFAGDFRFPESTPSRRYRVVGFHLGDGYATNFDLRIPKRVDFDYGGSGANPALLPAAAQVTRENVTRTPGSPLLEVPWCRRFDLQVLVKEKFAGLNQARLNYRLHLKDLKTGQPSGESYDFSTRLSDGFGKNWVTSISAVPQGTLISFSIWFDFYPFDPDELSSMEFFDLQLMSSDFKEASASFGRNAFGIKIVRNNERLCDHMPK